MSGETERFPSAWTVDSLLAHFDSAVQQMDRRFEERFIAQEKAFDTALTGIKTHYDALLAERDRRYDERVQSQEKAVEVSFKNLSKDLKDQIEQVRHETIVAMEAADKAISKSEITTEKRFESVNEFRSQQADIISTFARKSEIEARLIGITEKVEGVYAQSAQIAASALPRNEYDRAHVDLAERVIQVEKALVEKMEAQAKAFETRIALLQSQVSSLEAITR